MIRRGIRTLAKSRVSQLGRSKLPHRGSFKVPLTWQTRKSRREEFKPDPEIYNGYDKIMADILKLPNHNTKSKSKSLPKSEYEALVRSLSEYIDSIHLRENPTQIDKNVWALVRKFKYIKPSREDRKNLPLQLLVDLFEVAKVQPNRFLRIKQVGDVIYSYGARLDAINESDYIDSLFTQGDRYKALELWSSRQDTKDWIYWMEIGASLHLRRYDADNAEKIARNMHKKFGYIPPKLMVEFIRMYAEKRDPKSIMKWYKAFMDAAVVNSDKGDRGILETSGQASASSNSRNLTFDQAVEVANKRNLPNAAQLYTILEIILEAQYWNEADTVIQEIDKIQLEIPVKRVLQIVDNATKQTKKKKRIHSDFVPMLTTLISIHPQVLNSSELYQSWLRGLTTMGLYNNALQVLDAMVARELPVDMNVFIQALLSKDQVPTALQLLDRMRQSSLNTKQQGSLPSADSRTYALFIRHATRNDDIELLDNILNLASNERTGALNESSMNLLLNYYAQKKQYVDKFLSTVKSLDSITTKHSTFRTSWILLRKYYQRHRKPLEQEQEHDQSPLLSSGHGPQLLLRQLMHTMIANPDFRKSVHVYETAIHTMILAQDYVGAAAILAHMDRSNVKPQGVLAMGVLQLTAKTRAGSRAFFPHSKDLASTQEGDPAVPWRNIVILMCRVLDVDAAETIKQSEHLFK